MQNQIQKTDDDEPREWTPSDPLGRPLGIWRQGPRPVPYLGTEAESKPYQLYGYHSPLISGGVLDAPAIRWRDTRGEGERLSR